MTRTDKTFYEVYRSRNNGEFWSNLTYGTSLSYEEGLQFIKAQNRAHPSDLLRLVEVNYTTKLELTGKQKDDDIQVLKY